MDEFGFLKPEICTLTNNCANKYGACFAYLMNTFDKDECANLDSDKNVCTVSDYIKVLFFGATKETYDRSRCGLKAISNILSDSGLPMTKIFQDIISSLKYLGYDYGFSIGGVPNDFRRFITTNQVTTKTFRYLIQRLYENTGKPVIIISHSFGNLVTLSNFIKFFLPFLFFPQLKIILFYY